MKSYRDNGGAGGGFGRNKTAYDDVFGGPPKFGATTLPPRLEDYTEIFQGFHASRGSSIPVLDLPPPSGDSDDVWFDVQTSKLDYSEVFGGFNGLDFAVSYEELFGGSKVGDDESSDDVWTPAQSESLSDESDPCASLEMNQQVPTSDLDQSFVMKKQFNLSQNTANLEAEKDVSSGMTNDSQFHDVPGSTVVGNEKLFSLSNNNHYASKDFGGVTEGKRLEKSLSQTLDSGFGSGRYGSDLNHSVGNRPILSVSDLSLKTQPSHLPPPSRPPPALTSKKGDSGRFNSKLKTSKSYAFERMTDDGSPPYFDVEIDASSSAAADAAAMKDAVEQAQAKLRSAKELMDRKKEGLQIRSKIRVENNVGDKKGRVVLETFEMKEDGKNVQTREVCELEEKNVKQETHNKSHREEEHLKEPTEKRFLVSQQLEEIKTPSEADESELYENLIEIQLKNNEMVTGGNSIGANEKVVTENRVKNDNEMEGYYMGSDPYDWEDYDIGLQETIEKEHAIGLKDTKEQDVKEVQKPDPPEIEAIQCEEENDQERAESERTVEDPLDWEENEKISVKVSEQKESDDNISEMASEQDENKKEQTFLQEEEKKNAEVALEHEETVNYAGANEKIETIHETDCNSEENIKIQDPEREESKKRDEAVPENDGIEIELDGAKWEDNNKRVNLNEENESSTGEHSEASDVVYQVDENEIQHDIPSEKNKTTPETPFCSKNEGLFCSSGSNQNDLQHEKAEARTSDVTNSNSLNENATKPLMENDKRASESTHNNQGGKRRNDNFQSTGSMETKSENRNKEKEEKLQRERELENDRLRKLEEERERQIEREKDRMAVDRATIEAHERAFAETRERAERAAVERATAEFRQRALAEARERLEKACAEAREKSLAEKASEGRLRVEKATAEARERAERSVVDKFSAPRSGGMRQNSLSSDMPDSQFQKVGSYNGLRYSQTAAYSGGEGESPQRCKARLERHQRTADRAAKALAEKNMRDLIAQKEQAERNRLAEGLDAEVKRWSSGKQGNLRALLSTLQYILGSDSGWQPVPLTEVITTAAVKKAYRKATLCVHPDKLQQRGASIQQKYICEKVFDLLKEAWNKFNSEER